MDTRFFRRSRRAVALVLAGALAGCAQLSVLTETLSIQPVETASPEKLTQDIGRGAGTLEFAFELDNKADKVDSQVGTGYIVVLRDGKELQALPHVFEMQPSELDAKAWLEFADFNRDGFVDFKVARVAPVNGQLPLESVFQFDRASGTFALIEALSGVGKVNVTTPGCVGLDLLTADGAAKQERLCFATAGAKWVFAKPGVGRDQAARAQTAQQCDPLAPSLKACQLARTEAEARLQKLMREYRSGKKKALQKDQGKGYAEAYAKTFDWDHLSWRRYRDARCAVQVREQALSPKELPAATALCRYDWTRDQLRRYEEQVARLTDDR